MWVVLLLSLTWLYVVEYMVPFARNIKWIENASQSFYESYSWVEETLLKVYSGSVGTDYSRSYTDVQDYQYTFTARGLTIPEPWLWNSNYDENSNYSTISQTEPITLAVWNNLFWWGTNTLTANFRVPNFDQSWGLDSLWNYNDLILWQLSSPTNSLTSKNLIWLSAISKSVSINLFPEMWLRLWDAVSDTGQSFSDFYTANCWAWNQCALKLSVINPLESPSWWVLPFLEYRLVSSDAIPYPNTQIRSEWKSYGFTKILDVYIPQQSTNSAFDFTVLQ